MTDTAPDPTDTSAAPQPVDGRTVSTGPFDPSLPVVAPLDDTPADTATPAAPAGPSEDPNAAAVTVASPTADPKPELEYHAQTGTVMLHYYEPGLDADAVTRMARATGADVIGAPDDLGFGADEPHWRIQVRGTGQHPESD